MNLERETPAGFVLVIRMLEVHFEPHLQKRIEGRTELTTKAGMIDLLREHWLRVLIYGGLICCAVDAFLIEPHWIRIEHLAFGPHPSLRIVHISDLHYKGDHAYVARVVDQVNRLHPEVVCFTGDIVEDVRYLDAALNALGGIQAPVYGVHGNHEYWSGASFEQIAACFRKTGGDWLVDRSVGALGGKALIAGSSGAALNTRRAAADFAMPGRTPDWTPSPNPNATPPPAPTATAPGARRILLTHYPADVDTVTDPAYDLILSGHSHGGQVRLPWFGALIVPFGVKGYQKGLYSTPAGRLHVSSGLGTFFLPVRFGCRPEITLIEL